MSLSLGGKSLHKIGNTALGTMAEAVLRKCLDLGGGVVGTSRHISLPQHGNIVFLVSDRDGTDGSTVLGRTDVGETPQGRGFGAATLL